MGNLGQVGPQGILNIMGFGCIILIIIGPSGIPGRQFYTEGPRGAQGKAGQFVGGIKINKFISNAFSGPKGPKGLPGCQGPPGNTVQGPKVKDYICLINDFLLKGPPGDPGRPGKDGRKFLF